MYYVRDINLKNKEIPLLVWEVLLEEIKYTQYQRKKKKENKNNAYFYSYVGIKSSFQTPR